MLKQKVFDQFSNNSNVDQGAGVDFAENRSKKGGFQAQVRRKFRSGTSVFINYVSKRIHTSTLKEAFAEYENVIDVYIAYHSPKRRGMRRTFAFVRFANFWEALNVVDLANNRRMDGFSMKVQEVFNRPSFGNVRS
ncbi:hypothetical protein V6N11_070273 [Hibiscus sabdariffa]|uniref:RRM domain-containing protein n=2 Tax=Hibiscus sabdariffa TaxID=183260 RepID=A0ABR2QEH7_9ROSI